ncbi:hypothetical protein [Methanothermococcus okinawensis]|uniref:O-antigen polymerase n=1 Tax=Methanothermococcus okinawensis (strain DSM 14208 / JCM 11175 / IH1) TaxID=647113 RepID=F8ALK0_METOI|nr:hypothetical protein [Methanothermococcus okinawensis]AEH07162.1 protein of unknown function DUF70 [Methanothermococcus okinawensis IH1]
MHICDIIENIKKINLFHPISIVVFGHLIIFVLALPYLGDIGTYSLLKILGVLFIFILGFSLPFIFPVQLNLNKKSSYILFLYISSFILSLTVIYGAYEVSHSLLLSIIYLAFIFVVVELYTKLYNKKLFVDAIFGIGVISFILVILIYGGIPLFDYNIRMSSCSEPLRLISTGALIYAGIENKIYFIISLIILTLFGYKGSILMLFVSYVIYKKASFKHLLIYGFVALILLSVVGEIVLLTSNQHWKIHAIEILCYRAHLDLTIFLKIINSNIHTYGQILFTPNGQNSIGDILYNYHHNLTTTMFGTSYLDFGYFGVLIAVVLGLFSKFIYEGDKKLYAIYASILLSYCEVGLNYGIWVIVALLLYINIRLTKYNKE